MHGISDLCCYTIPHRVLVLLQNTPALAAPTLDSSLQLDAHARAQHREHLEARIAELTVQLLPQLAGQSNLVCMSLENSARLLKLAQTVGGQHAELASALQKAKRDLDAARESDFLLQHASPNVSDYYYTCRMLLNSRFTAAVALKSGIVAKNTDSLLTDMTAIAALSAGGVPLVSTISAWVNFAATKVKDFSMRKAINALAEVFAGDSTVTSRFCDEVARRATFIQLDALANKQTKPASPHWLQHNLDRLKKLKDDITGNNLNEWARKEAKNHSDALLKAIVDGEASGHRLPQRITDVNDETLRIFLSVMLVHVAEEKIDVHASIPVHSAALAVPLPPVAPALDDRVSAVSPVYATTSVAEVRSMLMPILAA